MVAWRGAKGGFTRWRASFVSLRQLVQAKFNHKVASEKWRSRWRCQRGVCTAPRWGKKGGDALDRRTIASSRQYQQRSQKMAGLDVRSRVKWGPTLARQCISSPYGGPRMYSLCCVLLAWRRSTSILFSLLCLLTSHPLRGVHTHTHISTNFPHVFWEF